ncbi:hypothetical protein GCM10025865_20900 [Paraoerskovia sediminicola]|uniref:Glycosyl hydrolase family 13 catalytic domain-containing protein n=1 Tax=Paraoerskovia sediminicola TaxID=1138587 RepID=A0ABM8G411_9CELL|nr:hypothetical protein GCM10025865_20900 [Paraoerskovia sediminicola]
MLVGEIWLPDVERFAMYLRPDEMHTAFNFDFMTRPWDAKELRTAISATLAAHAPVGAPPTWVLSNHDITRPVTRYGREDSSFDFLKKRFGTPTDLALGERRSRAAALLTAALPGSLYIYQGDELGLPEVEDLPLDAIQDPMHFRSEGVDPGRDGCRVPLPWTTDGESFGFSDDGSSAPWLPQPEGWGRFSAQAQADDPRSMLSLYRAALAIRRAEDGVRSAEFAWVELPGASEDVLAFSRGDGFVSATNFGVGAVPLPDGAQVLLASTELDAGQLPSDASVWFRP